MSGARAPLLMVALTEDAERLRGALILAAAEAALGGAVRFFLQLDSVALLRPPIKAPRDGEHEAQGLPTLAALLGDALDLGVRMTVCQSGLALAGLTSYALDARIGVGGPVGTLAETVEGERLVLV